MSLRAEQDEDRDFLEALFKATHAPPLLAAGLAPEQVDALVVIQFRSQYEGYRAQFPDAAFSIIERDGVPVGRFVEQDEVERVYFVDIAIVPEERRSGLAFAVTRALIEEWAARGHAARVRVRIDNAASLALVGKLGFVETSDGDDPLYRDFLRPLP